MDNAPLKTSRFRILFFISWLLWTLLHALVLYWFGYTRKLAITDSVVSNLLLAGTSLLVVVSFQFYIPQKNKYGYILALCGMLSILWLLVSRALLLLLINDNAEYSGFFSISVPVRLAIAFLIIGCMALVSVLLYTLNEQQETEKRKMETDQLSREAELFKLRQQLQPHFLFNSLNSINALITAKPQLARTMIQQLSDFLRGTLKKDDQQWISLEEELQHLQLYLEIEKVRFGHRLDTKIENETEGRAPFLPLMLLQPIVENAIKFGLYDTTGEIVIRVKAVMDDETLQIEVQNPFDPETAMPNKGTGFGLNSVRRRLYLLFARNDLLHTITQGSLFITTVKIPQHHDQVSHN